MTDLMTPFIQRQKIITLPHTLVASTPWTEDIKVGFVPDIVIVKAVAHGNVGANALVIIKSSLVGDTTLVAFGPGAGGSFGLDIPFILKRDVDGIQSFRAENAAGGQSTNTSVFAITLEFRQYSKSRMGFPLPKEVFTIP